MSRRLWQAGTEQFDRRLPAPPRGAAAGAEVDDVVGAADGVLVVLDHQQRVAAAARASSVSSSMVVARVQADGRLVEDAAHAGEVRPSCAASRMRCASPPDSVGAARSSAR